MAISASFDADGKGFVVDAPTYVPNEKLGNDARAAKQAIRTALADLAPGPDEVLAATFAGLKKTGTDVENLLFNNIDQWGDAFVRPAGNGLSFEDLGDGGDRPAAFRYRYRLQAAESPFLAVRPAEPARCWGPVELVEGDEPTRLTARTWWTIRHTAVRHAGSLPPDCRFAVRLTLGGSEVEVARVFKSVIDGAFAAFQLQMDRPYAVKVAEVLAPYLPGSREEIAGLLTSHPDPMLGTTAKLLWHKPTIGEVQWNPDDARCIAGCVTRGGDERSGLWLSGELMQARLPE